MTGLIPPVAESPQLDARTAWLFRLALRDREFHPLLHLVIRERAQQAELSRRAASADAALLEVLR